MGDSREAPRSLSKSSSKRPAEFLSDYPKQRDSLLSALHEMQRREEGKTWISESEIKELARHYDIPLAELDGIVSFYTMFAREKRGRHVIKLCDSLSCRIGGSLDLYQHLRKKLGITAGATTSDGEFTLEIVNCLGACDKSPNLSLDNALFSGITVDALDALLDGVKEAEK